MLLGGKPIVVDGFSCLCGKNVVLIKPQLSILHRDKLVAKSEEWILIYACCGLSACCFAVLDCGNALCR